MSKIGKRAILILLALPIGFNVMAQEIIAIRLAVNSDVWRSRLMRFNKGWL